MQTHSLGTFLDSDRWSSSVSKYLILLSVSTRYLGHTHARAQQTPGAVSASFERAPPVRCVEHWRWAVLPMARTASRASGAPPRVPRHNEPATVAQRRNHDTCGRLYRGVHSVGFLILTQPLSSTFDMSAGEACALRKTKARTRHYTHLPRRARWQGGFLALCLGGISKGADPATSAARLQVMRI